MAGVSGINSVHLARLGCRVTLVDGNERRLEGVRRIWRELGLPAEFAAGGDMRALPYPDAAFDLAWQWAGLWYLPDAEASCASFAASLAAWSSSPCPTRASPAT